MSRLQTCFTQLSRHGRKGLIPFITAGDPVLGNTVAMMHALVAGGANVIELGVPFSDPMADGPVIQRASERALAHHVGLRAVLAMAHEFRQTDTTTPVVLMGYANPIERMGIDAFVEAAVASGIDGVLVVDYPPEESTEFAHVLKQNRIDPIFLIAPTTPDDRVRAIAQQASGYVYYVALKGVTGAGHLQVAEAHRRIMQLRHQLTVPVGVGFGIRDTASARELAASADAVVIGSRLIEIIEQTPAGEQAAVAAQHWLHDLRVALDQPYLAEHSS